MRQRILDTLGAKQRLFVMTNAEVRGYIKKLTDQWFGLTYVQIAVAVRWRFWDRRADGVDHGPEAELGVLQAVGVVGDGRCGAPSGGGGDRRDRAGAGAVSHSAGKWREGAIAASTWLRVWFGIASWR